MTRRAWWVVGWVIVGLILVSGVLVLFNTPVSYNGVMT